MAYFYCDIYDAKKRTVTDILRLLVTSLLSQQPSDLSILEEAYEDCEDGCLKPSDSKLQEILGGFISGFEMAYILIDALDEQSSFELRRWKPNDKASIRKALLEKAIGM